MSKKLLKEQAVRRFMKLARIDEYSQNFVDSIKEEELEENQDEIEEMKHPADRDEEAPAEREDDMDMEEDKEVSITEEEAEVLVALGEKLKGEVDEPEMDEPEMDEPEMDEPEMDMPAEEPEEEEPAMRGYGAMEEELIKKIASRVAERVETENKKRDVISNIDVEALAENVFNRLVQESKK